MAEIERCSSCKGECDEAYLKTVLAGLTISTNGIHHVLRRDKQNIIYYRLREIIGCGLEDEQINSNLDGLEKGTLTFHGR